MPGCKHLMLLRHAKSDWSDEALIDFDRPLNKRGRGACELLAGYFTSQNIAPDLVLSSPARRAASTIESIIEAGGFDWPLVFEKRLYLASAATIANVIKSTSKGHETIMVVGHNPGLGHLASLAGGASNPQKFQKMFQEMVQKFPTGGFAEFKRGEGGFENDFTISSFQLTRFVRPKDLTKV